MPTRYYKYLQELNQGTQPTPSPSPRHRAAARTSRSRRTVCRSTCPSSAPAAGRWTTFWTPWRHAASGPCSSLRRMPWRRRKVSSAGWWARATRWACPVPGQSLDGARAALEEGAGLLEQLVRVRPHTVYLEGAASGVADALEREGWACWSANVDGRPDGRSQSTQANALLRTLEGRRSAAACCWTTAERAPESCPGCCPACRGTRIGSNWRWIPGSERIGAHTAGGACPPACFEEESHMRTVYLDNAATSYPKAPGGGGGYGGLH